MPNQVDGALLRTMSGTELSRVRTEYRLRPPEPTSQSRPSRGEPTLLCNQVGASTSFRGRRANWPKTLGFYGPQVSDNAASLGSCSVGAKSVVFAER